MTTRAAALLGVVHARPGITRAEAAKAIGVGTGAATELVARLEDSGLLAQAPAAPSGSRGRPTTVLLPHPAGPLIAAAAITPEDWRVDVVELGGHVVDQVSAPLDDLGGVEVIAVLSAAVDRLRAAHGTRLRGLGLSVPGPVTPDRILDATNLQWHDVDLGVVWNGDGIVVVGNDASFAAAAESRRGAGVGVGVLLHLHVLAGLGGALVLDGEVQPGATGTAGEFGHMPFGDPAVGCPCGANGCWGTAVDGTAMARRLGEASPPDPISYARRVLAASGPRERDAVRASARALGRGVAGLVNALDPAVVTLGGLGADLLTAAPEDVSGAYLAGLMTVRRTAPPPVVAAELADEGPISGAGEEVWSRLLPVLVAP